MFWHSGAVVGVADAQAPADANRTPVLAELFTSEGCNSCPPADRILEFLSKEQPIDGVYVVAMSEHVTYWDHQGWKDPFGSQRFTERQNMYGNRLKLAGVYTPQLVIDGTSQLVGSDTATAARAGGAAEPETGSWSKPRSPPTAPSPGPFQGRDWRLAPRAPSCSGPSPKTSRHRRQARRERQSHAAPLRGRADVGRQEDRARRSSAVARHRAPRMEARAPSAGGVRAVDEDQARAQRRLGSRSVSTGGLATVDRASLAIRQDLIEHVREDPDLVRHGGSAGDQRRMASSTLPSKKKTLLAWNHAPRWLRLYCQ